MKNTFLLIALLLPCLLVAQYQITIDAYLIDKNTNKGIAYTNINIEGKDFKAISDIDGRFSLTFDEEAVLDSDKATISHYGYKKLTVKMGQLFKLLNNSNKIYLVPKPIKGDSENKRSITGTVYNESGNIQGATVRVKGSLDEVKTDFEGYFKINAEEDDVLVISYLGMKTREVIAQQSNTVSIELESDGELLEEILIEAERKEEETETGFGKKTKEAIGYDVTTIKNEDFPPGAVRLVDIIRGRAAGVTVQGFGDDAQFILRGKNSLIAATPAIFDVDGMIYTQTPFFLDINQIKSISFLRSLASTNKYGAIARGGVIKITMNYTSGDGTNGQRIDQALVRGNDYDELNPSIEDITTTDSGITKLLSEAKSLDEAKRIYGYEMSRNGGTSIPFLLDASKFFNKSDKVFSQGILDEIFQVAFNNPKALKALGYELEVRQEYEKAKEVYQRVAILRPQDVQSYRDLALSYVATGNYQDAMKLYKRMLDNNIPNVDFAAIEATIINEIKHLVANHRQDVEYRDLHPDLLSVKFKTDVRFVFDWNDPNSEFEFQFVNPKKKYYTWAHTKFDNLERMQDEVKKGYHTEEYIIDDADKGEWIINIRSFGKEDKINPTYLKYTVYTNYGLPEETKEVKVIKLYQYDQKVTLDKFMYKG